MTFEQAQAELVRHRDLALTAHGNTLLGRGLSVDSEEFRKSMLEYAGTLETWRFNALRKIGAAIKPAGATSATWQ